MLTEDQLDVMQQMVDAFPAVLAYVAQDGSALLTPAHPCPVCEDDPECVFCEGKGGIPLMLTPVLISNDPAVLL